MKQNTLNNTQLPTEEEFKKIAWKLKEEQGIKLTAALNQLSIKYGFKSFNAIKPMLKNELNYQPNEITEPHLLTHTKNKIDEETIFKKSIDFAIAKNELQKAKLIEINIPELNIRKIKKYYNKFHDYLVKKKYTIEQFEEDVEEKIYLMYHPYTLTTLLKNGNYLVNSVELIKNNEYIIIPDNPKKLKHRNRKCILISIEDDFMPRSAEVKFLDTKRVGIVELADLKILISKAISLNI